MSTTTLSHPRRIKVEPFTGDDETLTRLVTEWAFKPYRWADVPDDSVTALSLSRLRPRVRRDDVWTAVAMSGEACLRGIATLEPLPWDSRMLGVAAARLEFVVTGDYAPRRETVSALLDAATSEARKRRIEHLSVRVDAEDTAAIHSLEAAGFLSVDSLLTFERAVVVESRPLVPDLTLRDAREEDMSAMESMAAMSFVDGRFHADPSIPTTVASSIYREWAAACCRREVADNAIVAVTGAGEVVGFLASRLLPDTGVHLRRLTATIVLIATKSGIRRRGVGRELVMASLDAVARHSAVVMQAGTQIRNTAAARLYERCGFRLAAGSQSFRAVISPRRSPAEVVSQ